jgi:hypothetical protein
MDASWQACPYCRRETEAKVSPKLSNKEPQAVPNPKHPTKVEPSAGRETKYQAPTPHPGAEGSEDNRRIIGVLVTYTWRPQGDLFAVKEGRTHIGAGAIKDDPEHKRVDVFCPRDELLSGDHAMILVQQKKFYIRDLASSNGTFVNGEQILPETSVELPHSAEIKTGKTVFTFLKIEPRSAPKTESPGSKVDPTPPKGTILR